MLDSYLENPPLQRDPKYSAYTVERPITMTPDAYLSRIREMVASSQHAEALAFADDHADTVDPPLSIIQELSLGDVLHVAAMAVGMDEHAARLSPDKTAEVA